MGKEAMGDRDAFETLCWVLFGAVVAVALGLLYFGGPEWLVSGLLWASFALAMPLIYADLRRRWLDIKAYEAAFGWRRLWALLVGTVAFILLFAGIDMWLSNKIGWPEAYGFECSGRGCLVSDLIHSPELLRGGNGYELGLFALLWLFPAIIVVCAIFAIFKRRP